MSSPSVRPRSSPKPLKQLIADITPQASPSSTTSDLTIIDDERRHKFTRTHKKILIVIFVILFFLLVLFLPIFFLVIIPSAVSHQIASSQLLLDFSRATIYGVSIPSTPTITNRRLAEGDDVGVMVDIGIGLRSKDGGSIGSKSIQVKTNATRLVISSDNEPMGFVHLPGLIIPKGSTSLEDVRIQLEVTDDRYLEDILEEQILKTPSASNRESPAISVEGNLVVTVLGVKVKDVPFKVSPDLSGVLSDLRNSGSDIPLRPADDVGGSWYEWNLQDYSQEVCVSLDDVDETLTRLAHDVKSVPLHEDLRIAFGFDATVLPIQRSIEEINLGEIGFGLAWLDEGEIFSDSALLLECDTDKLVMSNVVASSIHVECQLMLSPRIQSFVSAYLKALTALSGFNLNPFYIHLVGLRSSYAPFQSVVRSFGVKLDLLQLDASFDSTEQVGPMCLPVFDETVGGLLRLMLDNVSIDEDGIVIRERHDMPAGSSHLLSITSGFESPLIRNLLYRLGVSDDHVSADLALSVSPQGIIIPTPRADVTVVLIPGDDSHFTATIDLHAHDKSSASQTAALEIIRMYIMVVFDTIADTVGKCPALGTRDLAIRSTMYGGCFEEDNDEAQLLQFSLSGGLIVSCDGSDHRIGLSQSISVEELSSFISLFSRSTSLLKMLTPSLSMATVVYGGHGIPEIDSRLDFSPAYLLDSSDSFTRLLWDPAEKSTRLLDSPHFLSGEVVNEIDPFIKSSIPYAIGHVMLYYTSDVPPDHGPTEFLMVKKPTKATFKRTSLLDLGSILAAPVSNMEDDVISWRLKIDPRYLTEAQVSVPEVYSTIHPLSLPLINMWQNPDARVGIVSGQSAIGNGGLKIDEAKAVNTITAQMADLLQPQLDVDSSLYCVDPNLFWKRPDNYFGARSNSSDPAAQRLSSIEINAAFKDLGFNIENFVADDTQLEPADDDTFCTPILNPSNPIKASWLSELAFSTVYRDAFVPVNDHVRSAIHNLFDKTDDNAGSGSSFKNPVDLISARLVDLHVTAIDRNDIQFDECAADSDHAIKLEMSVDLDLESFIGPIPLELIRFFQGHFWVSKDVNWDGSWDKPCRLEHGDVPSTSPNDLLSCFVHSSTMCSEAVRSSYPEVWAALQESSVALPLYITSVAPASGTVTARVSQVNIKDAKWTATGSSWLAKNVGLNMTALIYFKYPSAELDWGELLVNDEASKGQISGEVAIGLMDVVEDDPLMSQNPRPIVIPPIGFNLPWSVSSGPLATARTSITPRLVKVMIDEAVDGTNSLTATVEVDLDLVLESDTSLDISTVAGCVELPGARVIVLGALREGLELLPIMDLKSREVLKICTAEHNRKTNFATTVLDGSFRMYTGGDEVTANLYETLMSDLVSTSIGEQSSSTSIFQALIVSSPVHSSDHVDLLPHGVVVQQVALMSLMETLRDTRSPDSTPPLPPIFIPLLARSKSASISVNTLNDSAETSVNVVFLTHVEMLPYSVRFETPSEYCPSGVVILGASTTGRIHTPEKQKIQLRAKSQLVDLSGTINLVDSVSGESLGTFLIDNSRIRGSFVDDGVQFYELVEIVLPEICTAFDSDAERAMFQKVVHGSLGGEEEEKMVLSLHANLLPTIKIPSLDNLTMAIHSLPVIALEDTLALPSFPISSMMHSDAISWIRDSWLIDVTSSRNGVSFPAVEMEIAIRNDSEGVEKALKSVTLDQLEYEIYLEAGPRPEWGIVLAFFNERFPQEEYDMKLVDRVGRLSLQNFTLDMTNPMSQRIQSYFTLLPSVNSSSVVPRGTEFLFGTGRVLSMFIQDLLTVDSVESSSDDALEALGQYRLIPNASSLHWSMRNSASLLEMIIKMGTYDRRFPELNPMPLPEVKFAISPDIRTVACLLDEQVRAQIERVPLLSSMRDLMVNSDCNAVQLFFNIENPWGHSMPITIENIFIKDLFVDSPNAGTRLTSVPMSGDSIAQAYPEENVVEAYKQFLTSFRDSGMDEVVAEMDYANALISALPSVTVPDGHIVVPLAKNRTAWIPGTYDENQAKKQHLLTFPGPIPGKLPMSYGNMPMQLALPDSVWNVEGLLTGFPVVVPLDGAIGFEIMASNLNDRKRVKGLAEMAIVGTEMIKFFLNSKNDVVADAVIWLKLGDYRTSVRVVHRTPVSDSFKRFSGKNQLDAFSPLLGSGAQLLGGLLSGTGLF
eukprot:GHVH01010412.1.p1 GENE.GHVH01010412.1~~GHVH01010412.1.p1  ORF type:complete len:2182 (+),score=309.83 GHVH01010412.1:155-6700(+)